MKRGEIWTVAGGPHYSSKPRPAVILQADRYIDLGSIVICPFTSDDTRAQLVRIPVFPTSENGLRNSCWLMVDKMGAVPRLKLRTLVGLLDPETLDELNRAIIVFLHLDGAHPTRAPRRR